MPPPGPVQPPRAAAMRAAPSREVLPPSRRAAGQASDAAAVRSKGAPGNCRRSARRLGGARGQRRRPKPCLPPRIDGGAGSAQRLQRLRIVASCAPCAPATGDGRGIARRRGAACRSSAAPDRAFRGTDSPAFAAMGDAGRHRRQRIADGRHDAPACPSPLHPSSRLWQPGQPQQKRSFAITFQIL